MSGRDGRSRLVGTVLLLAGVGLLFYVVYHAGFAAIWENARSLNAIEIVLAVALCCAVPVLRGVKWHLLMRGATWDVSLSESVALYGVGGCAGFLTPGRAGEAAAALALKRLKGIPVFAGMAMILADKVIEVAVLLVAVAAAGLAAMTGADEAAALGPYVRAAVIGGLLVLVLLVIVVMTPRTAAGMTRRLASRLTVAVPWLRRLANGLERLLLARRLLSDRTTMPAVGLVTALTWLCDLTFFFVLAAAIGRVGFVDHALAQLAGVFAGVLTAIPGGLGISALSYAGIMAELGYEFDAVATAAVLATGVKALVMLGFGAAGGVALSRIEPEETLDTEG